jgi:hypothetical protein
MNVVKRGQGGLMCFLMGVILIVGIMMLSGCAPVSSLPPHSRRQAKQTISHYNAVNYTYCYHCVHYTKFHGLHLFKR